MLHTLLSRISFVQRPTLGTRWFVSREMHPLSVSVPCRMACCASGGNILFHSLIGSSIDACVLGPEAQSKPRQFCASSRIISLCRRQRESDLWNVSTQCGSSSSKVYFANLARGPSANPEFRYIRYFCYYSNMLAGIWRLPLGTMP
jgi:hypothetical protein